ncbi:MAG: hypothetical protein ACW981_10910 [Candidatus Hodarchaeales archaeon]|jgi:hypothetical protein
MALKSVVRKRVRSPRRILDLNYVESKSSILNEQKRASEVLVEEGDLYL